MSLLAYGHDDLVNDVLIINLLNETTKLCSWDGSQGEKEK